MPSELLFSRVGARTAVALLEDDLVVELRVEDGDRQLAAGDVVKARVGNVVPGIQAAFLDVGEDRDAFLHVSDLHLPGDPPPEEGLTDSADPDGVEDAEEPRAERPRRSTGNRAPIEDRLKTGREIVVQVARESLGGKGPRVTCFPSLPGRFLVYAPAVPFRAISRRIADESERARLKGILATLPPAHGGFIVRTAGAGASEASFRTDAERLVALWQAIEERARTCSAPARLHEDDGLLLRTLRDAATGPIARIVVDGEGVFEAATGYLRDLDPVLASRLVRHEGARPLFEERGVAGDLEKALRPRVWLRSGGTIVIQPTEALVSIDVNTGKFLGSRRADETVLRTNLEAAREIARQLRLRDLGGIIVVDFIDMERGEDRQRVLDAFAEALRLDRSRTKIVGLSELGLVQLTRKRVRPALAATLTRPCVACAGEGRVKSAATVAHEALSEVRRLAAEIPDGPVVVSARTEIARALRDVVQTAGPVLDARVIDRLRVEDDDTLPAAGFDVAVG